MATHTEIASQWIEAQQSRDADKIEALGELMTDDIVWTTPRGEVSGKPAILERLQNPPERPGGGMMGQISWGEPTESGSTVKIMAELPPGLPLPIKGLELALEFNDEGKIAKAAITPQR
jgi:hypothetical protein